MGRHSHGKHAAPNTLTISLHWAHNRAAGATITDQATGERHQFESHRAARVAFGSLSDQES